MWLVVRRNLYTAILCYLIVASLAGCQAINLPVPPPPATPQASPEPVGVGTLQPPTPGAGRLAYVGGDGNVYVTPADLETMETTIAVTSDATASAEGPGLSYHRLSWSPDGRLAFAAVTRSGNDATSKLYVVDAPGESPRVVAQNDEHFVIYMYWSPTSCPDQPSCRHLAYLIEETDGVGLHMVRMNGDAVDDRLVGIGRPFYFSWSPDGRQILWHTGGAGRHDAEARIALYDVEGDSVQTLPHTPGLFHAPAWSPQGNGWLGVVADGEVDQLLNVSNPSVTLAAAPDRQMAFTWSPDGNQVAYAVQKRSNVSFFGSVHVFDVRTGETRQLTNPAFDVAGFFWSPDGRRIAYLSRLSLPDSVWMQWRVYDVANDVDRGFTAFHPSFQMRFMISSFNQYAQSHRFWSPDSRYLVYADRDRFLVERVWLVDTWAEKGADPIFVDQGSLGVWSWN